MVGIHCDSTLIGLIGPDTGWGNVCWVVFPVLSKHLSCFDAAVHYWALYPDAEHSAPSILWPSGWSPLVCSLSWGGSPPGRAGAVLRGCWNGWCGGSVNDTTVVHCREGALNNRHKYLEIRIRNCPILQKCWCWVSQPFLLCFIVMWRTVWQYKYNQLTYWCYGH